MNNFDLELEAIKRRYKLGLLTQYGYILDACHHMEVDPAITDRQWLSEQLEIDRQLLNTAISRMRAKGLFA